MISSALKRNAHSGTRVKLVRFKGERFTYEQLALKLDLTIAAVKSRVRSGKDLTDPQRVLRVEYAGARYTLAELSKKLGISRSTLQWRVRHGYPLDAEPMKSSIAHHRSRIRTEAYPGANDLPWEEDPYAQRLVDELGALSSVAVADLLGVRKQRVAQLERSALKKFARNAAASGMRTELVELMLARLLVSDERERGYQRGVRRV